MANFQARPTGAEQALFALRPPSKIRAALCALTAGKPQRMLQALIKLSCRQFLAIEFPFWSVFLGTAL